MEWCRGTRRTPARRAPTARGRSTRASRVRPSNIEGSKKAEWVLLDYFDFVIHVFSPAARAFYGLERLWGSARHIPFDDVPAEA